MAKKYIAPSADLMLDGIVEMPRTEGVRRDWMDDTKFEDEPYLHREDNIQATRDAIKKFGYPKLGTQVTYNGNLPKTARDRHAKPGVDAWIVGYTKAPFSSRDGEYTVHVAYPTIVKKDLLGNAVFACDGMDASWMSLEDGTVLSDTISFGATQYKKCACCKKPAKVGTMHMGKWCNKPRCTLVAMRESI